MRVIDLGQGYKIILYIDIIIQKQIKVHLVHLSVGSGSGLIVHVYLFSHIGLLLEESQC